MSEETVLARECRTFGSYLIGGAPSDYVAAKYAHAHAVSPAYSTADRFDLLLVRLASVNRILTRIVDAYAALLAPTTLLRRKLVLLLAILETSAPSSVTIDRIATGSWPVLLLRFAGRAAVSAICVLLATPVLVPARFALARKPRNRP